MLEYINLFKIQLKYSCMYMYVRICVLLDFGKPTESSHSAYFILLYQLIAALIHYPCTTALPGLQAGQAYRQARLTGRHYQAYRQALSTIDKHSYYR